MKSNKKLYAVLTASVAFILALASFITMPTPVFATNASTVAYNWYAKRNSEHTMPRLEPQFSFICKYDAFYGDAKAAASGDKVIYLTFDAGYENGNIARILDTLKKHDVPAAFFVLKNLAVRSPELVKRMAEDGHLVCNHTATHPNMTKITDKTEFARQLSSLHDTVKQNCGIETSKFYRPPEGAFSEQNLQYAVELGYKTVFWSFAYADWNNNKQPSREDAIKKILDNVHPGEIMLLHPTSKTNADILDEVITRLKAEGYRFASLNEIC